MPLLSWTKAGYEVSTELLKLPNVRESPFQLRLGGGKAKCTLCYRGCTLDRGQIGLCGMRVNIDGSIYTVAYGLLTAAESRPMEIKPLYHFHPRTSALTISTWGCNFPCAWCQNYHLSKYATYLGNYVPPERLIEWTLTNGDSGINVSFNEPTMLAEYAIDVFRLAKQRGLHTSINTNGYLTLEALEALRRAGLDGANFDIKGGRTTYREWLAADFDKFWSNVEYAVRSDIHVELTYLVIPDVNDWEYEEVIEAVAKLGREIPLHITGYYPAHLMDKPATSVRTLERIWERARRDLDYVYVGNVPGHPAQHTYCPNCGAVVIRRRGDRVVKVNLDGTRCPNCGREIYIRGSVGNYGRLYRAFVW